jgi:3-oxoacyl-[acyl-carrier-protein] synthase III
MSCLYSGVFGSHAVIDGSGIFLPSTRITNSDIYQDMCVSGALQAEPAIDWIQQKTGIRARRRLATESATSDMCCEAGWDALRMGNVPPSAVDCLVIGSNSPDYLLPSTALMVRERMALDHAFVMDLNQFGCSATLFALFLATTFLKSGLYERILVIGADVMSRLSDCRHPNSVFFGDAASAFLVRRRPGNEFGFLSWDLRGQHSMDLCVRAGGSRHPIVADDLSSGANHLYMNGRSVWDLATKGMTESINTALQLVGMRAEDVDLFIFHQANLRLIHHCMSVLNVDPVRAHMVIEETGNTSTASLGLAFNSAFHAGKIGNGAIIVFAAAGAGFFWGASVYKNESI